MDNKLDNKMDNKNNLYLQYNLIEKFEGIKKNNSRIIFIILLFLIIIDWIYSILFS
jgi:hypothetical protein